MQKALDQMNPQIHHVISDITGLTGLAMIGAILDGERNTQNLALLSDETRQGINAAKRRIPYSVDRYPRD